MAADEYMVGAMKMAFRTSRQLQPEQADRVPACPPASRPPPPPSQPAHIDPGEAEGHGEVKVAVSQRIQPLRHLQRLRVGLQGRRIPHAPSSQLQGTLQSSRRGPL